MSQVEDLLNSLTEDELKARAADMAIEPRIVIDESRIVFVPDELKRIGVQYDHNIETVVFDAPRFWDGHDLSRMKIYINYMSGNGRPGCYIADEVKVDEQDENRFRFEWTISANVTEYKGKIPFLVCAKKTDEAGNESLHWNSELNTEMYVSEGLECMETIEKLYPDIYTQLLYRMDEYEKIGKEYMDTTISYAVGTNGEFREGDETDNAKYYYNLSKSYTVGTGGVTREGDDTDNAKYYKEGAEKSAANAADSETNAKASEDMTVQKVEEAQEIVNTSQEHLEEIIIERKRIETVVENSENPLISSMATSYEELMAVEELGTIPDAVAVRDGIIDAKNNPITYTRNKLDEFVDDILTLPSGFTLSNIMNIDGKIVATGVKTLDDDGSNYIIVSEDGVTWSNEIDMGADYAITKIIKGKVDEEDVYVAITDTEGILFKSSDFKIWNVINYSMTIYTSQTTTSQIYDILYENNIFVAAIGGFIAYSTDLISWTSNNSSPYGRGYLAYGNGMFVAIRNSTNSPPEVSTSVDGINWIKSDYKLEYTPTPGYATYDADISGLHYANGVFVALSTRNMSVDYGRENILYICDDPSMYEWDQIKISVTDDVSYSNKPIYTSITNSNGLFFTIGHMTGTGVSKLVSFETGGSLTDYFSIKQTEIISESDIYTHVVSTDHGMLVASETSIKHANFLTKTTTISDAFLSQLINESGDSFHFGVLNGRRGYYTDPERTEESFHSFDPEKNLISNYDDVMANTVEGYSVDSLGIKEGFERLGGYAFYHNPTVLYKKEDNTPVVILENSYVYFSSDDQIGYDYLRYREYASFFQKKVSVIYYYEWITDESGNVTTSGLSIPYKYIVDEVEYYVDADSNLGKELLASSDDSFEYFAYFYQNDLWIASFEKGLCVGVLSDAVNYWSANYTIKTIEGDFYGRAGADTVRPFSNFSKKRDVSKLEKINIASITQTSSGTTGAYSGSIEVLYDGAAAFNDANSTGLSYYVTSSSLTLEITVDKPFYLAFIRTPYKSNNSVVNPISFTIGDYTSPTISRVSQTWTKIPYIGDDMDYLELDTTFEITLKGGTYTGMTELEIYGFYKE